VEEFQKRLQARSSLRFADLGDGVLVSVFTEDDMWAEEASSRYITEVAADQCKGAATGAHSRAATSRGLAGLFDAPPSPIQRVSSSPGHLPLSPSDAKQRPRHDIQARLEERPHAAAVHAGGSEQSSALSRALYWMVVVCSDVCGDACGEATAAGDALDACMPASSLARQPASSGDEGGARDGEPGVQGGTGEGASAGSLQVSHAIFRPMSIGLSGEMLEEEVRACAQDACRAILLNQMHETRRFDARLLPPETDEGNKSAAHEDEDQDRNSKGRGQEDGSEDIAVGLPSPALASRLSRSSSRMSIISSEGTSSGSLPDVEMLIEREREKEREKERAKVREKQGSGTHDKGSRTHEAATRGEAAGVARQGADVGGRKAKGGWSSELWCSHVQELAISVHERILPGATLTLKPLT